jgi:hypothetical protein
MPPPEHRDLAEEPGNAATDVPKLVPKLVLGEPVTIKIKKPKIVIGDTVTTVKKVKKSEKK